ncbi:MAG: glycogen debranching protein GlgX [Pseudomonadales bacterium]|nr:glycogen debranching protein GlgX [Pseudomonadales bacterium]
MFYESSRGNPYPLGSCADKAGVNFALYSATAQQIELCVFDQDGYRQQQCIAMHRGEEQIWHVYLPGATDGLVYGYRLVNSDPATDNLEQNWPLILDPYAKLLNITENVLPQLSLLDADKEAIQPLLLKAKVCNLQQYRGYKPSIPWSRTIIYECHVKGATYLDTQLDPQYRGKFLALAQANFIGKLKKLGITAIELLPVQHFLSETLLSEKGLSNYWGYNTVSFFSPHADYLLKGQAGEFQQMVRTLHLHDIEVIIDVVYNHTAEGNDSGPLYHLKALDKKGYYRLEGDNYINDTGCGNTLNISHPRSLQLVLDSLRYWANVMGVDGFRFDLATILARDEQGFNPRHAFLQAIAQDPLLNQLKMIAEPWDIGPGGYQLGKFPAPWREWNDAYRDTIRRFWRAEPGVLPIFAQRIHGSSDLFQQPGRGSNSSINYITAHDGFTLEDLVSYEKKNNGANTEQNRDGQSENYSQNHGIEGPSEDPQINALRLQQQKNMLLTLIFSQGVPMLCAGSESQHTQAGNNNAYCQDNNISWISWDDQENSELSTFIAQSTQFRQQFSVYQYPDFIHPDNRDYKLHWYNQWGLAMTEEDWQRPDNHALGYMISNRQSGGAEDLLIVFNASIENFEFSLPLLKNRQWQLCQHSLAPSSFQPGMLCADRLSLQARSSWVLCSVPT